MPRQVYFVYGLNGSQNWDVYHSRHAPSKEELKETTYKVYEVLGRLAAREVYKKLLKLVKKHTTEGKILTEENKNESFPDLEKLLE